MAFAYFGQNESRLGSSVFGLVTIVIIVFDADIVA
jgi:hypothetical protein